MARVLTEAEKFAIRLVYGPVDPEPLPVYSLGREERLRREKVARDRTGTKGGGEAES